MLNFLKLRPFSTWLSKRRGGPRFKQYEPKSKVFMVSRSLVLGLAYPFDWGFIPVTKVEDGIRLTHWRCTILRLTPAWCCPAVCRRRQSEGRKGQGGEPH